jgi:hypothetical protein
MKRTSEDSEREHRIYDEIIVDAYDEEERAMGWYYYLDGKLHFPFKAKCIEKQGVSPLLKGEEVEICGMAQEDECLHEIFVKINWKDRQFAVPLVQLFPLNANEESTEAIEDWHYWRARGYQF